MAHATMLTRLLAACLLLLCMLPSHHVACSGAGAAARPQRRRRQCLFSVGVSGLHGLQTIDTTLRSYVERGLAEIADQTFVFYQEADRPFSNGMTKRSVVEKYGFEFYGHPTNSKWVSVHDVVRHARCKYVAFLEEDWLLFPTNKTVVATEIRAALTMLESGRVHVVRERSRYHSGEPNHALLMHERGLSFGDTHLLHSVHWSEDPAKLHPGRIWRCHADPPFWCATSANADFSLNPTIFAVDWWRREVQPLMPGGDFNPDIGFHAQWAALNITVAQGMGLFMHNRLDRDPDVERPPNRL